MVAQEALYEGMRQVKPGVQLGQIGTAISTSKPTIRTTHALSSLLLKITCGHGIGSEFHGSTSGSLQKQ
ncbi:M24 family metallopeptidase [Vibrio lentus]|nr:M24 family metallopeptidase [Vibrio lentus]